MTVAQQTSQAIFVAWQDPQSRRFYPVARLISGTGPDHNEYECSYIQGATEANKFGFKPFVAFPELNRVYRSRDLFPFFQNRLMGSDRTDFPSYLQQLGLDATDADDMTILARSGGIRATDTIELFLFPAFDPVTNRCRTTFLVHGLSHLDEVSRSRASRLQTKDRLLIMADCQNPADGHALALRTTDDRLIVGYLPHYLLLDSWTLLQSCGTFEVYVEKVNLPPAPLQQRLLCRLESCWPVGFVPFNTETYRPIASDSASLANSAALP